MTARTWRRARRATQLAVALGYLALPLANAAGLRGVLGTAVSLRVGPVDLTEPAAALSAALAAGAEAPPGALALGAAPLVLLALLLGPVFCSWLCPFGLASELLDRALPWRRRGGWAPSTHVRDRAVRWSALAVVLAGSVALALPLGALVQGPRAITTAVQEGFYLGSVSPFAAAVLGALLVADLVLPRRLFCRALCPAGALANALRTPRTVRVAYEPARCRCAEPAPCRTGCPWAVDPRSAGRFDGCRTCVACVEACPTGALRLAARAEPAARRAPSGRSGGAGSDRARVARRRSAHHG